MNAQLLIEVSALAASFLFIYGLKRMSSPVTARSGIVVAGYGMLVAGSWRASSTTSASTKPPSRT